MVINYDLPMKHTASYTREPEPDCEVYLHRVGRAGRFGRKGNFQISLLTLLLCSYKKLLMLEITGLAKKCVKKVHQHLLLAAPFLDLVKRN